MRWWLLVLTLVTFPPSLSKAELPRIVGKLHEDAKMLGRGANEARTPSDRKFDVKLKELREELDAKLWHDEERLDKFHTVLDELRIAREWLKKQIPLVAEAYAKLKALEKIKLTKEDKEMIEKISTMLKKINEQALISVDEDFEKFVLKGKALSKLQELVGRYTFRIDYDEFDKPITKAVLEAAPFLFEKPR